MSKIAEALRQISLCSQNSMSSKEECGRIARAALAAHDAAEQFPADELSETLYAAVRPAAQQEPVSEPVSWRWSESNGERWFDWTTDWDLHRRALATKGCLIQYAYLLCDRNENYPAAAGGNHEQDR